MNAARIPPMKCVWLYLALCIPTNFLSTCFDLPHFYESDPGWQFEPLWHFVAPPLLTAFYSWPIRIPFGLTGFGSHGIFFPAMLFFLAEPFLFIGFGRGWLLAILASIHIAIVSTSTVGFWHVNLQ